MRLFLATLALAGALTVAHAGNQRAVRQWGGADFPFSCDTVRAHQLEIKAAERSPDLRRALIQKFHISRKMQRQARACLKKG